ncbi:hypothetical protein [Mycoplasma sp. 005V]|uniref:YobI family P-loop NTPase n=1 Tax=unclassified Mycoplasma TaxID=2683645 RepID=UPI003A8B7692
MNNQKTYSAKSYPKLNHYISSMFLSPNVIKDIYNTFIETFPSFEENSENAKSIIKENRYIKNVAFISEFGFGKSSFLNTFYINNEFKRIVPKQIFDTWIRKYLDEVIYREDLENNESLNPEITHYHNNDDDEEEDYYDDETLTADMVESKKEYKNQIFYYNQLNENIFEKFYPLLKNFLLRKKLIIFIEKNFYNDDDDIQLENFTKIFGQKNGLDLFKNKKNIQYIFTNLYICSKLIQAITNVTKKLPLFISTPEFKSITTEERRTTISEVDIQKTILNSLIYQTNKNIFKNTFSNTATTKSWIKALIISIIISCTVISIIGFIALKIANIPMDIFGSESQNITILNPDKNPLGSVIIDNDINPNIKYYVMAFYIFSFITFFVLIAFIFVKLIDFIRNKKYLKIKLKSFGTSFATFESENEKTPFEIQKHTIFSLISMNKSEIIIFEDLDRLSNKNIFNSLHKLNYELNLYLENSKSLKMKNKQIKFIYVMSDSVFENKNEKNKFFDIVLKFHNSRLHNAFIDKELVKNIRSFLDNNSSEIPNLKTERPTIMLWDKLSNYIVKNINDYRSYLEFENYVLNNELIQTDSNKDIALFLAKKIEGKEELQTESKPPLLINIVDLFQKSFDLFEIKTRNNFINKRGEAYNLLKKINKFKESISTDFHLEMEKIQDDIATYINKINYKNEYNQYLNYLEQIIQIIEKLFKIWLNCLNITSMYLFITNIENYKSLFISVDKFWTTWDQYTGDESVLSILDSLKSYKIFNFNKNEKKMTFLNKKELKNLIKEFNTNDFDQNIVNSIDDNLETFLLFVDYDLIEYNKFLSAEYNDNIKQYSYSIDSCILFKLLHISDMQALNFSKLHNFIIEWLNLIIKYKFTMNNEELCSQYLSSIILCIFGSEDIKYLWKKLKI